MFEVLEWIALYDKAALGLPNACGQVRPLHIIYIYIYIYTYIFIYSLVFSSSIPRAFA